jgi:hypothetical protein
MDTKSQILEVRSAGNENDGTFLIPLALKRADNKTKSTVRMVRCARRTLVGSLLGLVQMNAGTKRSFLTMFAHAREC